ncbi:unnamed protein product [Penicillium salamii]|nr:unnamed protein product [Penicillium salamii]
MSLDRQQEDGIEFREEGRSDFDSLCPADQGIGAWKFLFASWVLDALLWGLALAYGVFQDHYQSHSEFAGSPNIPVVGAVSTSIYFLGAPFATHAVMKFPRWRYHTILVGSAICVLSLVGASFAPSVAVLIATQGVLFGLGFLGVFFPLLSFLDEWFIKRRAFAYAVLYSGSGCSGVAIPFLAEWLLSKYGFRTTLRIFAVAQVTLLVPILPFIRGRLPASTGRTPQKVDLRFLKAPMFWGMVISNSTQSFAYYIPSIYLPMFATNRIGLSGKIGALVLAALNLATVIGQLGFGALSDRVNNALVLPVITGVVSSTATFLLWGFAKSLSPLLVFSVVYGLFAGAYVVVWPRFGTMLSDNPQLVYSLMAFSKGTGNISTAPISAALLQLHLQSNYGTGEYGTLIIYLGSLMLLSSFAVLPWLIFCPERHRMGG